MPLVCPEIYPADREDLFRDHFDSFGFPLSDFQKYAVEAVVDGHHALVCAPTGSGKTLPAEFAIRHFISRGKKVIYTSPIKALSNQKYYEFSRKFPDISVGLCTGDIKTNPTADLLIMTAEILNNSLFHLNAATACGDAHRNAATACGDAHRNAATACGDAPIEESLREPPSKLSHLHFQIDIKSELGAVVMDEVHYINDAARGHVWEQTIMALPPHIQMVMLSATLDCPEKFAEWIESTRIDRGRRVYLAATHTRIVPLTHYAFLPTTEAALKTIKNKEQIESTRAATNKLVLLQTAANAFQPSGHKQMQQVLDLYDAKEIRMNRKHTLNSLAKFMKGQEDPDIDDCMLPAIVFVFSRKQVEQCAAEMTASLWPFDAKEPYVMARECEQIVRKLPNYREYLDLPEYKTLVAMLERGVAIHHSGMIPVLREIVELMIGRKCVRMLFATESFAIGLDCPIRSAVFTGVAKFDGAGTRFLLAHEYTQMAGRAGRRGIDTVGHVVHLPTMYRDAPSAKDWQRILSGKPQTLESKFHIDYGMVLGLMKNGTRQNFAAFAAKSMVQTELGKQTRAQSLVVAAAQLAYDTKLRFRDTSLRTPIAACEQYSGLVAGLPRLANRKRKDAERAIAAIKAEHKFAEQDAAFLTDLALVRDARDRSQTELTNLNSYIEHQTELVVRILEKDGFIVPSSTLPCDTLPCDTLPSDTLPCDTLPLTNQKWTLSALGVFASNLAEIHPLVFSRCAFKWNQFEQFSVEQLIGLFAVFCDIRLPEEHRSQTANTVDAVLKIRVKEMQEMYLSYQDAETSRGLYSGIEYGKALCMDVIDELMDWSKCNTKDSCSAFLQRIDGERGIGAGDFIKAVMKTCALAKEVAAIADQMGFASLAYKLEQIDGRLLKYITSAQSLYL